MKLRITDMMNGFFDNDIEMEDPGVVDADRVRELTMAKLGISQSKATRRPARKMGRLVLVAAAVVMVLSAAAVAVYQHGMRDRLVESVMEGSEPGETYMQYSPVGAMPQEETHVVSIEGKEEGTFSYADSANREYYAFAEWQTYFWSEHEEDLDVLLPYDSPYRYYGLGYEGLGRKLEEVAAKYDLRLYKSQALTNWLDEFYEVLGTKEFLEAEEVYEGDFGCTGTIYDDGSFQLMAVKTPYSENAGETVSINVYRAMKGTFCDFLILGDDPEDYIYETYETVSGELVDLALGKRYSMIFAELEDCYVTVFVNGGTEPGEYLTLLDMDAMKYIADAVDYSALEGAHNDGTGESALELSVAEELEKDLEYQAEQQANMNEEQAAYYAEVGEIVGELGCFAVAYLPEGYTADEMTNGGSAAEARSPWVLESEEIFATAYLFFTYNDGENPTLELYYERCWEDESKAVSVTNEVYEDCKAYYMDTYPEQCVGSLSVNGADAFARSDEMYIELIWMDEANDLRFSLMCRNNGMHTLDDVIAMAESVAAQ